MENREDLERWEELVAGRSWRTLQKDLSESNEIDIAEFLETLDKEKLILVFRIIPKDMAAEVFANLPPESQEIIIESATDSELSFIIEELAVDDAVDMLDELPANVVTRVLKNAKPGTRKIINEFLAYPDNSVGSIMSAEFMSIKRYMTVGEALSYIRRTGEEDEPLYTSYVVDARRKLIGVVTLKELLVSSDDEKIADLMETDVIFAHTDDDREDAANTLKKYSLLSLPVVDREERLVGLVTVDDVMDVLEEEATEDFEKMAAILPSEKPYLKTNPFVLAKNRIAWLIILMLSGMLTGGILGFYEAEFAVVPLLVTFIPLLMGTGGNAGSQSSTVVIRSMAVGDLDKNDWASVLWKEMRVGLIVGVGLAAVNFLRLLIQYPGQYQVALTVSLTLIGTVVMAKTIGGLLPIGAEALKIDPALMASPLITTIVDALSLILYFSIAKSFFGIA